MDQSNFLKIYDNRAIILANGPLQESTFEEKLKELGVFVKISIFPSIEYQDQIRPELVIESILQYFKKNRNYGEEQKFYQNIFKTRKSYPYKKLKDQFAKGFSNFYGKNETFRVIHVIKRYALNERLEVDRTYFLAFINTSKNFHEFNHSSLIYAKALIYSSRKLILKQAWTNFKAKSCSFKKSILNEKIMNKYIASNVSAGTKICIFPSYCGKKNLDLTADEAITNTCNKKNESQKLKCIVLRSKLLAQTFKDLSSRNEIFHVKKAFADIIEIAKTKSLFFNRIIVNIYSVIQHKLFISLSYRFKV